MVIIFRILQYISMPVAGFCALFVIVSIIETIRNRTIGGLWNNIKNRLESEVKREMYLYSESTQKIVKAILVLGLFATIVSNSAVHGLIGYHNLEIKPAGTYCFYVEAENNGKSYVLPAQIKVEQIEKERGERTYIRTEYYIEKIYFTNGSYIDFEYSDSVEIGIADYMYEQGGEEWRCTLLNEHAYSPYVTETNTANWFDITFLCIYLLSISLVMVCVFSDDKETQ